MLKSLKIKNMQSHKSTHMEFDDGMNVITGSSDAGKSSIIRAILLGVKNRPSGGAYKSWFAEEDDNVEITLEFNDGTFVRTREKDKNKYIVEGVLYEALRHDVPEAVQSISKIMDYNVQTQLQPYFLLQDSAGDRAKKLNELVGLNIMDKISKKLNSKVTLAKHDADKISTTIAVYKEQLHNTAYLPSIETLIKKLDSAIDKHEEHSGNANALAELLDKLWENKECIKNHQKILKLSKPFSIISEKMKLLESKEEDLVKLQSYVTNINMNQEKLDGDAAWLEVEGPYAQMKNNILKRDALYLQLENITAIITGVENVTEQIVIEKKLVDEKITEYVQLLEHLGICPVCESEINKTITSGIISKLTGKRSTA